MLVSILPQVYRSPEIMAPSKAKSADGEAAYTALYTMIIAIIQLSGGELSDPRLRRHLTRLNAAESVPSLNPNDPNAPVEKTELVLQRMIKQGYLIKVVEDKSHGDEESIMWYVGPRGKVEADNESLANLIRAVYGGSDETLEKKLQRSLKVKEAKPLLPMDEEEGGEQGGGDGNQEEANDEPGPSSRRRRSRRQAANGYDEDDE